MGTGFTEIARRKGDFAIVLGAAKIGLDGEGRCSFARIVLGAVAPVPLRCAEVEARLIGRQPDAAVIAEAVAALPRSAFELDSQTASLAYRLAVAPVVLRRAIEAAVRNAREAA